jgi:hypothetical protein
MNSYNGLLEKLGNRERRKLCNNTWLEKYGTDICVRLHGTNVLTFRDDGTVVFNSGGYMTATTKDRLNSFGPVRWFQKNRAWFASTGEVFKDGCTWKGGVLSGCAEQSDIEKQKDLKKRIAAYCAALAVALPLPVPGAGDCFYCQMKTADGKPLGEAMRDTLHLSEHMRENYFVPSLVWSALEFNGCQPQGGGSYWFQDAFGESRGIDGHKTVCRMVKKYLLRQFGIA